MGRPEKDGRCKNHPSHKHSIGVCPYCLRERLANISDLSASSTAIAASSTSCSSTAYSSYESDVSSISSASPPPEHRSRKRFLQILKGRKRTLRSSWSFSFPKEGETKEKSIKKGASRFFARLMMAGRGRKEEGGLTHSKTVKEKPSSKWAFFS